MTINELKIGDILTYRNGKQNIVNKPKHYPEYYNENLTHYYVNDLDIMKIERYIPYKTTNVSKSAETIALGDFDVYMLETIYERKEENKIEKIGIFDDNFIQFNCGGWKGRNLDIAFTNKINEIIDRINKIGD